MDKESDFYNSIKISPTVPQLKIGNISYRKMFYFDEKLSASEIDIPCEKRESCLRDPKLPGNCLQRKPRQDKIAHCNCKNQSDFLNER